jgi:uncharacterized protein (TIGR03067 family)
MRRLLPALLLLVPACNVRDDVPYTQELHKLQGTWLLTDLETWWGLRQAGGVPDASGKPGNTITIQFSGDKFVIKNDDEVVSRGRLDINPTKHPKTYDLYYQYGTEAGKTQLGIYELDGDTWYLCAQPTRVMNRPTEMSGTVEIFRRQASVAK